MKNLFVNILAIAVLALLTVDANAQIRTPQPSPASKLTQTVGLTEVTIEYSRPSAKGRAIFGTDGIVPFETMWRTGANAATKLTFSDDVKINGQSLKKGSYAIFTKPGAGQWDVMLFNYDTPSAGGYGDKKPVISFSTTPVMLPNMVETFTIGVNNITNTTADIDIAWEKTSIKLPLEVEFDSRVMADIERAMAGPGPNEYAAAANYYMDNDKDLNKAIEWIQKANAENPRYWNMRTESLILAKAGKYADAVKAAEKSKMLAKEAGDDNYVRMNDKSIAEWKAKMPAVPATPATPAKQSNKKKGSSK
ncbi:MAG TPA: DUF2911 domain-containing protein [Saprospiraceae bacterium]|nr:DUF2911 domain-containing protein [Saprospiraceae bacterium]HMP24206.1 DUF2911 domain-containing protein [Saprospiraceae bacterium]